VNGSIAPALIEETAILIEGLKEVEIRLGTEPLEVADFEVGPL